MNRIHLTAIVWLISSFVLQAQKDSLSEDKVVRLLPVPAIGYEPETTTYLGGVILFTINPYRDGLTRTSNAKLEFNYTFRNQAILDMGWNYFFREEKWFTRGYMEASYYPDFYYGIGASSNQDGEVLFESRRWIADLNLFRQALPKFFIGFGAYLANYTRIEQRHQQSFPELRDQALLRVVVTAFYDDRDNLLNPRDGSYMELTLGHTQSERNYPFGLLDFRQYLPWNEGVFAMRLLSRHVGTGAVFFDQSIMGGDEAVRGYFYGRFRDRNMTTTQYELRTSTWHRLGLACFGGLSYLYHDVAGSNARLFYNYGAGLRFLIDRKEQVNLRFDYAIGADGQSGFYIGFGESF